MTKREELIELTGQAINGILSSDGTLLSKIFDRATHTQVSELSVSIASEAIKRIDKITGT